MSYSYQRSKGDIVLLDGIKNANVGLQREETTQSDACKFICE